MSSSVSHEISERNADSLVSWRKKTASRAALVLQNGAMDAQQILQRMTDGSVTPLFARDVGAAYAAHLATIIDRLSPEEVEVFLALGAVIAQRATRIVPVLGSIGG